MPASSMFDSHMHTPLCRHAVGEPEEYAARAVERGLRGIIFTCHSPMPEGFWPQVRMSESDFDDYVAMIGRCRDAFAGELEVRLGIESDYFPGYEGWIEKLHQRAEFHHCLGSVHWQGPEYAAKFNPQDEQGFRKIYWENLAASAETGLFDTLAHPDLIKNYRSSTWRFEDWQDDVAAALDRIARTGVAMELNTSGLNKVFPEMNPGPPMLRLMRERGIPVVIGSDSHAARRVGENFVAALELLRTAGYASISVFEKRRRQNLPLDEVLGALAGESRDAQPLAGATR
jgi:histidinol-phosphatase (PHP family)